MSTWDNKYNANEYQSIYSFRYLYGRRKINNKSSILLLKVSPNVANELLNKYRPNLDQIERKFSTKIMTFIDPYKQNDVYTIEIKKNAYFDYNKELEDSSKAFPDP